jgi:hypothetical protein
MAGRFSLHAAAGRLVGGGGEAFRGGEAVIAPCGVGSRPRSSPPRAPLRRRRRHRHRAHGLRRHAVWRPRQCLRVRALLQPRRWARLPFLLPRQLPGTEADRLDLALWTEAAGAGGGKNDLLITKEEDSFVNFRRTFCNIPPNLDRD